MKAKQAGATWMGIAAVSVAACVSSCWTESDSGVSSQNDASQNDASQNDSSQNDSSQNDASFDAASTPGADGGSVGSGPDAQPGDGDDSSTQGGTDAPFDVESAAPPTCSSMPALQPGDTNGMLTVGGQARTYTLHVPPGYTGRSPVPLVIDFHYLGGTGSAEETYSGYSSLADQKGFVVALPNGIDHAWNIGPCCTMSRTVDDLGFVRALVAELERQVCVNPKRVYGVGVSMGGGMSHYVACNAADVFAAVAPSAFDLLSPSEMPCNPSRPITEISFRGTADMIVPYAGGPSMPPNGLNVTINFLGAVATFQRWAELDQCTGSPSAPDSNGCQTYSQCAQGTAVTLCTAQGGGHAPGSAAIGWAMLDAHPMP